MLIPFGIKFVILSLVNFSICLLIVSMVKGREKFMFSAVAVNWFCSVERKDSVKRNSSETSTRFTDDRILPFPLFQ